jgi:hypothetical protein
MVHVETRVLENVEYAIVQLLELILGEHFKAYA